MDLLSGLSTALALIKGTADTGNAVKNLAQKLGAASEAELQSMELRSIAIDLMNKVIQMQSANLDLRHQVEELYGAAKAAEKFDALLARYRTVRMAGGGLVLELDPDRAEGEPLHSICPACVQDGKRMFLQPRGRMIYCQRCKAQFEAEKAPDIPDQPRTSRGDWGGF